jgi:hypothetical protein
VFRENVQNRTTSRGKPSPSVPRLPAVRFRTRYYLRWDSGGKEPPERFRRTARSAGLPLSRIPEQLENALQAICLSRKEGLLNLGGPRFFLIQTRSRRSAGIPLGSNPPQARPYRSTRRLGRQLSPSRCARRNAKFVKLLRARKLTMAEIGDMFGLSTGRMRLKS